MCALCALCVGRAREPFSAQAPQAFACAALCASRTHAAHREGAQRLSPPFRPAPLSGPPSSAQSGSSPAGRPSLHVIISPAPGAGGRADGRNLSHEFPREPPRARQTGGSNMAERYIRRVSWELKEFAANERAGQKRNE